MDKAITNKWETGTSDQFVFKLPNRFRKIPLLVIYYLNKLDDVM